MAWMASRDEKAPDGGLNPRVESPNAVAYVTYTHPDGRKIVSIRVPYAAEIDLLNFLARECDRLDAVDVRNAEMAAVVAASTLTAGPITFPDLSKRRARDKAALELNAAVQAELSKKLREEAIASNPDVAAKLAVYTAAQEALEAQG